MAVLWGWAFSYERKMAVAACQGAPLLFSFSFGFYSHVKVRPFACRGAPLLVLPVTLLFWHSIGLLHKNDLKVLHGNRVGTGLSGP